MASAAVATENRKRARKKSAAQHAKELGEPKSTVIGWMQAGMPADEPARSEWVAARKIRREPKEQPMPANVERAKAAADLKLRMLKVRAMELKVAEEEGRLIPKEKAEQDIARMVITVRNALLAVPRANADRLAAIDDPREHEKEHAKIIKDVLRSLSGDRDD